MSETDAETQNKTLSRRRFLRQAVGGVVATGAAALSYTYWVEPHWVEVVKRPMPIANLPESLVGRRLVQISDLHVGEQVDQNYLIETLTSLADLKPDAIVITGDFMTCMGGEQINRALEVLRYLPTTPLGNFGVFGNHDYGNDWSQFQVVEELQQRAAELGVRILRNDVVDVAGLQIAGIDDLWAKTCRPKATFEQLDPNKAAITLCHNPDTADKPAMTNYQGWLLAGHTHGGQCSAPFWGPPILPVKNKRYAAGEIPLVGNRRLYINRGLGYTGMRVRFNCRPEITLFTLESATTSLT